MGSRKNTWQKNEWWIVFSKVG